MRPRKAGPAASVATLLALAAGCGGGHPGTTTPTVAEAATTGPRLLRTLPAAEQATAAPLALAGDARHLFWTSPAGIVAADADGGSPRTLVADVFVTAMAVIGGELVYRTGAADGDDDDGAADTTWRIPVVGGTPRRLAPADPRVWALAELIAFANRRPA